MVTKMTAGTAKPISPQPYMPGVQDASSTYVALVVPAFATPLTNESEEKLK
jgi:hypothetical protein